MILGEKGVRGEVKGLEGEMEKEKEGGGNGGGVESGEWVRVKEGESSLVG